MGLLTDGCRRTPAGTLALLKIALNDFNAVSALNPLLRCVTTDCDGRGCGWLGDSPSSWVSAAMPGRGVAGCCANRGVHGSDGGGVVD